jgi:DNA-binding response OmpR family regulator
MWSSRKKILVVDDEPDITFTLHAILQKSGFEVSSFNDPLLALQSFKPHYYDLVTLDIKMPKMNGFELYKKLKEKDSRFVFLQPSVSLEVMSNIRVMYLLNPTKSILLQNQFQRMI